MYFFIPDSPQERRLKHEPMLHGVTADRECLGGFLNKKS